MAHRILLIEDETIMLDLLSTFLEKAGYRVTGATNAAEALASFEKEAPDLVLLDLVLPDENGIVILRKIRTTSNVPIVVLSGRSENAHRTAALELGANDFVNKGVDLQELLLRLRNILNGIAPGTRPGAGAVPGTGADTRLHFAGWTLNLNSRELINPDGDEVHMTRSEFQLLAALGRNPGNVVKREALVDAVSGVTNGPTERSLDTYMNRLRRKIEKDPKQPEIIQTLKGVGYKLKRSE